MFRRFKGFPEIPNVPEFPEIPEVPEHPEHPEHPEAEHKKGAVTLSVSCISVRSGISVGGGVRRRLLHSLSP